MMNTMPITIQVEERVARAYIAADATQRRKLDALLSLQLSQFIQEISLAKAIQEGRQDDFVAEADIMAILAGGE